MSRKKQRVILAFYGGGADDAQQALAAVEKTGSRVQHFVLGSKPDEDSFYSSLRLGGEELVVVQANPDLVRGIVTTLRTSGEPGIFFADLDTRADTASLQVTPPGSNCNWRSIPVRINHAEAIFKATRADLVEATRADHAVTESGKWFLDNTHLLRTSIGDIRRSLPTRFRQALSRFTGADGGLRICTLAGRIVRDSNSILTEQSLADAVARYQTETALSIAELWAFPVMLRFGLVEALAELAHLVSRQQRIRESAYLWANRLAAAARAGDESQSRMLEQMKRQTYAAEPYFATVLAEQLQDEEAALIPTQRWIEAEHKVQIADLVREQHNREAAESVSVANSFNSLRTLSHIDFTEFFENLNVVERELRRDPAGTYSHSDFRTRDQCRRAVETLACGSRYSEPEVARTAIQAAEKADVPEQQEVCWHLLSGGLRGLEKELGARVALRVRFIRLLRSHATLSWLTAITAIALGFLAITVSTAAEMGVRQPFILTVLALLSLFPLSELALQIVNALVIASFPPESLPKLDFDDGIPAEHATLVVVPMMLSGSEVIRQELEKLEVRYLANRDANLYFSLFSDFTDAPEPHMPEDEDLFEEARSGIEKLGKRYPLGRFLLFHRERVWSESERRWIGQERKRGKIEELNRLLRGKHTGEIVRAGTLPARIRYVITVDADTQLPPGSARKLAATIAHPLNRPVLDPETHVRRRGFSVIQPRVSITLPGATASRFTRIFADTSGTDPYCQAVSDAQQDFFGEAIFHGKAIYDVEAFDESVGERFPAETLLSHDLIEGSFAGVALASDIELFENMPLDYAGFSKRGHRWIRGDWQIAAWVLRRAPVYSGGKMPNPLSAISRWRILDNLRRSLVPVASMLLLLAGWMISGAPGVWSLVVGLAIAIPAVAPVLERLAHRLQGTVLGWRGVHSELLRSVVLIAFLPHQAWLAADAIGKALYRLMVTRRNLLEWQTADRAHAEARVHMNSTMRQMIIVGAGSLVLMLGLIAESKFAPVSVFVLLWAGSPGILYWLNRPSPEKIRGAVQPHARLLRGYARQTWRFFDDLVGESTNWLPPDNTQTALRVEVANRTSPTNTGLWLCSALAARDFGYLTPDDLLARCSKTLDTLNRMQRYEGHFLNWYNTDTCEPLEPRYVSTVDSGNLVASLWVFAHGARDVVRAPILSQTCMRGLSDTLSQLEKARPGDLSIAVPLLALRKLLRGRGDCLHLLGRLRMATGPAQKLVEASRQAPTGDSGAYWAAKVAAEIQAWNETADRYLRWVETLTLLPDSILRESGEGLVDIRRKLLGGTWSLDAVASNGVEQMRRMLAIPRTVQLHPRVSEWLTELERDYSDAKRNASQAVRNWHSLQERSLELGNSTRMGFLFDPVRKLFGIGYVVGGPIEFRSHYDLLASECRLASLVAIAKGDVPLEHWFSLGRPRSASGHRGEQPLLSWSGTMFEYLMPPLFTRSFDNSLLDGACRTAVAEQIEWGRKQGLPWGVSECAWSALDANQIYQYQAFGIPALALKPGLDQPRVIAPYATMLSLSLATDAAVANLGRLSKLGLEGPMGFYEAIDFTRESSSGGAPGVVIFTYMAHHQGMTLLAIDNALHRGTMRRRFHGDRRIQAIESLLFERVPNTPIPEEQVAAELTAPVAALPAEPVERVWRENTAVPRIHLYGNGRYSLMVTNAGCGYSRWKDFDVSRWRNDPASDPWGSFIYVRDADARAVWSTSWQPAGGATGTSSVRFLADHTEFNRRALDIETVEAITVAAEDDVELRRITITNWSSRKRELEFTSYAELALDPHAADVAHPAFAKMFVETEYRGGGLLIAHRRPRSDDETPIWSAHMVVGTPALAESAIEFETDRATFLGRGNTPAAPSALRRNLNCSVGTVVDPVFSLRCRVTLSPRDRVEISFLTFAGGSREEVLALAAKYRNAAAISRAFEMMWTRTQLQFRYLGIGAEQAHRFQELASYLVYPNPRLRPADRVARNALGQSGLWAFGISGDLPILAVTIADGRWLKLIRELLQAHIWWRMRGFKADLAILNQESATYDAPLRHQLRHLIDAHSAETGIDKPGGVFLRDWNAIPETHRNLLLASAGVVLGGNRGSLQQQLTGIAEAPAAGSKYSSKGAVEEPSLPLPFLELPYFNGQGGFSKDGREYAIYLKPGDNTPAPWVNVMASSVVGAMVSESGLGFTWRGNSQMNRLTPWNNDPVSDQPSEVIYLRDEESGACWSPTPQPIRESDAYRARHGQGYSVFEHNSHAIGQELTVFVPVNQSGAGEPVKIYRLRLRNDSSKNRDLSVIWFASLVLGTVREDTQLHIVTSRDEQSHALFARQYRSGAYCGHVTFAASEPAPSSYTCDRIQFLGRNRTVNSPAALQRSRLDNRVGAALDPCMALQVPVSIAPGAQVEVTFVLGQAESAEESRNVIGRCRTPDQVEGLLSATRQWWDTVLGALQVKTPLLSADLMLNRWLLYQSLSCRFEGRSAFYQSSGAMGFRDQMQDCLSFLYSAPQVAREHILRSAARQFLEGDVQHWWHMETGMGVRTRCSDDLVWLPFVTAQYVNVTGDRAILSEPVAFLEAPLLAKGEQEHLSTPSVLPETAPLWEHCKRALDKASPTGTHGLPLMGNGDWNDGMNLVGAEGRGESVWLAWFLASTLNAFADLMEEDQPSTSSLAGPWRQRAAELAAAVERTAWDGDWYLRAFFDNGTPLGSHANSEARIDSLPQSWAVISGMADHERSRRAMDSAHSMLVDSSNHLVRLFTPPFDKSEPHPGYIMGYPPGLRENGGQYTHGSLWLAMAWARLKEGGKAVVLLTMMSPVERTRTQEDVARYCGEPYAVAADVSTAPGRVGRTGWTWYTGSAAWMYRIWIEEVLGFRLRGNTLTIAPAIPESWPGFEIVYRFGSATYRIVATRREASSVQLQLDGNPIEALTLVDDAGTHMIDVFLPPSSGKTEEITDSTLALALQP